MKLDGNCRLVWGEASHGAGDSASASLARAFVSPSPSSPCSPWTPRPTTPSLIPFSLTSSLSFPSTSSALSQLPFHATMALLLGRPTTFFAPSKQWPAECTLQRTPSPASRHPKIGRTAPIQRNAVAWAIPRRLLIPPLTRLRPTFPRLPPPPSSPPPTAPPHRVIPVPPCAPHLVPPFTTLHHLPLHSLLTTSLPFLLTLSRTLICPRAAQT